METEKLNDKLLDKITGGNTGEPPIPWLCPFCDYTVMIRKMEDVEKHLAKCPKNPDKA